MPTQEHEIRRRNRPTTPEGDALRERMVEFMRHYKGQNQCLPTISELAREFDLNRNSVRQHLEKMRKAKQVSFVDGNASRTLRLR